MTDQALIILKEKFGTEFGADAVKEVAAQLNTSYATLSKYLNQYKVSRGKWNLDATVQDLEDTYNSPAVEGVATMSAVVQNLIPKTQGRITVVALCKSSIPCLKTLQWPKPMK